MGSKASLIIKDIEVWLDSCKILDKVSMTIDEGELVIILGPNGAGKTTLLRTIATVLRPRLGVVLIDGKSIHTLKSHEISKLLAYVPSEHQLMGDIRVFELLLMSRLLRSRRYWECEDDLKVIDRISKDLHIEALGMRRLSELSSGERQRVFIARALVQEPKILLLDEPTSHLDLHYSIEIMNLIKKISRLGLIVIMTTHDVNIASMYADKIIVIKDGKIRAMGKPEEVLDERLIGEVYKLKVIKVTLGGLNRHIFIPLSLE